MKKPIFWRGSIYAALLVFAVSGLFSRETLSRVTPSSLEISAQSESEIIQFVNLFRKSHGLNELKVDPKIIHMARSHSIEMREQHYFSHSSPNSEIESPTLRFHRAVAGQEMDDVPLVGENLFWLRDPGYRITAKEIAEYAENGFLADAQYRDNLLDPHFTRMGIGVARKAIGDQESQYWVTLNLTN